MVKACLRGENGETLLLGLSEGNLARLRLGMPICVNLKDLGLPKLELLIMYGKTEEEILEKLKEVYGDEALKKASDNAEGLSQGSAHRPLS